MRKAALYMRMSTDKQENSIQSQERVLREYAARNDIVIVEAYVDEGLSGRKAEKRPAFMRMVEDSAKGVFDCVLVYDSSRFARNLEESIVYKSALKRGGVTLISITEPSLDDDTALLTDAMLGALNEMYSRKLSKAVKRGMTDKARQGIYQVPPPFGYVKKNGVTEADSEAAQVVRDIFRMFLLRPSFSGIAARLNAMGIKNKRGNSWDTRGIKRILTNQAYIGNLYYNGEVFKGAHEPLIDFDTWAGVQEKINRRPKAKTRPPSYGHWLSGLLVCGKCGGRMRFSSHRQNFRCANNSRGLCRYLNSLSVRKLENLAVCAFESLICGDASEYTFSAREESDFAERERLRKSLHKVQARLSRHKAAYSEGIDSLSEYKANKEACLREKEAIERAALSLREEVADESADSAGIPAGSLTELLFRDDYKTEDKSLAVREVIQKIILDRYEGRLDIHYFV